MSADSAATIESATDASWAVEHFSAFWAHPEPAGDTSHLAADIVGCWPDGRVLHGIEEYRGRLIKLGALISDIRLDVLEYAVNGELAFIRWRCHGTGKSGPFELFGVDRLRVAGRKIVENIIVFDVATFESVAGTPLSSL